MAPLRVRWRVRCITGWSGVRCAGWLGKLENMAGWVNERAVDASRGLYEMNWPSPMDSVVLLGGGTRVAGANQCGVAISGVKTAACGGN
jgi:hypothetical protein